MNKRMGEAIAVFLVLATLGLCQSYYYRHCAYGPDCDQYTLEERPQEMAKFVKKRPMENDGCVE